MTVLTGHLNKDLLGWRRGISKQNTAIGLRTITWSASRRNIGGQRSQRWSPGAICNKTRRGGIMGLGLGIHQGEVHGNRSLRLQTSVLMHPDCIVPRASQYCLSIPAESDPGVEQNRPHLVAESPTCGTCRR